MPSRETVWRIFLALFAVYNGLLVAGLFLYSVKEWRDGHRAVAVFGPALAAGFTWFLIRRQQNRPDVGGGEGR